MTGCIILAAGQGKRMLSDLPKVIHPVLGLPMLVRVIRQARAAGLVEPVVVVGHGRELVIPLIESEGATWAVQEEQLGTAHAVRCGLDALAGAESITVLLGDVPLLQSGTVGLLEETRKRCGAAVAVLTTCPPDPAGYGRVIREGRMLREIVEDRDCTPEQLLTGEINTGLMSFDGGVLPGLLDEIGTDNDQGEYYLTDGGSVAEGRGLPCIAVEAADHREVSGVNDRVQLAAATETLRTRVLEDLMRGGTCIPDPGSVWVEEDVHVGRDVYLGRGCRLSGDTRIGDSCTVGDGCVLIDADLPGGTVLEPYTVIGWKGAD